MKSTTYPAKYSSYHYLVDNYPCETSGFVTLLALALIMYRNNTKALKLLGVKDIRKERGFLPSLPPFSTRIVFLAIFFLAIGSHMLRDYCYPHLLEKNPSYTYGHSNTK